MYRYDIPKDISEAFGIIPTDKRKVETRTISCSEGFTSKKISQIRNCIKGKTNYNTIVEIENFDYDDLRLEFKLNNRNKTISLKNIEKVVVSEDITKDVDLVGGNPTKESIIKICVETAKDYLYEMGVVSSSNSEHDETIEKLD